jgi:hypothetical protein
MDTPVKEEDFFSNRQLILTNISTEDWILGWIKMRESTASAPGGHSRHYKTAATVARLPRYHTITHSTPECWWIYMQ